MRALAVVAVLLYHGGIKQARGGFLGVDVFFVLSGYLVTSLVVAGYRKNGNLGFRRFWSARLRRLAPAQLALIVATTLVVAIWYRDELADLRGQVFAALTGTMNWYLILTEGSYFAQTGRPPLLRHLWSLAVELQFYLFFPPLLILALRAAGDRIDRIITGIGVAAVASSIYMALLYHPGSDPSRAYFDTFARLAAPLLGAGLALLWQPHALARGPVRELGRLTSAIGVGALVVLVWLLHTADDRSAFMYRGGFFLTAVISMVLVAAIIHPNGWLGSRWAFGAPALVAIGLRSYGLYLWHWPVYMLIRPRIDVGWSETTVFIVRIVITVVLTELCYRFIEKPWHSRQPDASFAGVKRRLLQPGGVPTGPRIAAIGSTFLVLVSAVIIILPHQKQDEINDSLEAGQELIDNERTFGPSTTTTTTVPPDGGTTVPGQTTTTVTVPAGDRTVTLVGDSVMVGASPAVYAAFGDRAIIDAKVSRQAADLAPVITQLGQQGQLGQVVVVQVGINGTVTDDDLHAVEAAAEGRPLYVINARVPRSWEEGNNELVKELVPELEKGHVIDWYSASNGHRDWFLDDGVHLTETGRAAYADLIRRSVDSD